MNRLTLQIFVVASFMACGCETRQASPAISEPIAAATTSATIDRVRKIVSEQMGVAIDKVAPTTSLGDLAADELDFVELIMELEESFSITIPDDAAEALYGERDWQKGMKSITIQKLAALVEDRSKRSRTMP